MSFTERAHVHQITVSTGKHGTEALAASSDLAPLQQLETSQSIRPRASRWGDAVPAKAEAICAPHNDPVQQPVQADHALSMPIGNTAVSPHLPWVMSQGHSSSHSSATIAGSGPPAMLQTGPGPFYQQAGPYPLGHLIESRAAVNSEFMPSSHSASAIAAQQRGPAAEPVPPSWLRQHPAWAAAAIQGTTGGPASVGAALYSVAEHRAEHDPAMGSVGDMVAVLRAATSCGAQGRPVPGSAVKRGVAPRMPIGASGTSGAAHSHQPPPSATALASPLVQGAAHGSARVEVARLDAKIREFYWRAEAMRRRWARKAERLGLAVPAGGGGAGEGEGGGGGEGLEVVGVVGVGAAHADEAEPNGLEVDPAERLRLIGLGALHDSAISAADQSALSCLAKRELDSSHSSSPGPASSALLLALSSPCRPLPCSLLPSRLGDVGLSSESPEGALQLGMVRRGRAAAEEAKAAKEETRRRHWIRARRGSGGGGGQAGRGPQRMGLGLAMHQGIRKGRHRS